MEFNTDKLTHHNFWGFYDSHFNKLKKEKLNILEIGILKGESLKLLKNYFNNSNIYGIDINKIEINEERIKTFQMSQIDFESYKTNFRDLKFDIIIDDGSHMTKHQIDTFEHLFETMLVDGGIYVIEDLHTSFRKEYINSEITAFEMVDKIKNEKFIKDNFKTVYKFYDKIGESFIFKKNENDFYDSITSIIYKVK